MAVAAPRDEHMTFAEYRVWAESKPDWERWELLDGVPTLMSPTSGRHQRIVMNLAKRLDDLAERKGCSALPGLAILSETMDDFAPIPDVVVRCGPIGPDGYTSDPVLVAEVLSPSTLNIDRGRKADFYKTVPSLRPFFVVYQSEVRIEVWRRDGEADWTTDAFGPGDGIALRELGGTIHVTDVYARVTF